LFIPLNNRLPLILQFVLMESNLRLLGFLKLLFQWAHRLVMINVLSVHSIGLKGQVYESKI